MQIVTKWEGKTNSNPGQWQEGHVIGEDKGLYLDPFLLARKALGED